MASIEKFCAPGVFDPASYSQGVKVSQPQAILFLSGQVAYTGDGRAAHRGDFTASRALEHAASHTSRPDEPTHASCS